MIFLGKTEFQTPGKYLVHVISDNKNKSELLNTSFKMDDEKINNLDKYLREISKKEIKKINSQIISELITNYYHEEKQFYFLDDLVDSHPYDFSDFKKINPYNSDNSRDNAFYKEYLYQTGIRTCYAVHIYKNDLDDKYLSFLKSKKDDSKKEDKKVVENILIINDDLLRELENLYLTKYPDYNTNIDTDIRRLEWTTNQKDNGLYLYNYFYWNFKIFK